MADIVYNAMIATLNASKNERFQVISEHTPETLCLDPTCLGIKRSAGWQERRENWLWNKRDCR